MPGAGQPAPEPAKVERETFVAKAEREMRLGKEKEAFDFLFASALSEESTDVLDKYRWVDGFKRPAIGVRWGIGFQVTVTPKSYSGSYFPVGSTRPFRRKPTRSRRDGRGGTPHRWRWRRWRSGSPMPGGSGGMSVGGIPGVAGSAPACIQAVLDGQAQGVTTEALNKAAGELSDELQKRLRDKIGEGDFGEILREFSSIASGPVAAGNGGGYPARSVAVR